MVVDFEKKKKILYFEWCLVVVDRLSARKKKKKMIAKFSRSYFLVGSCNCKCQMVPRDGEGPLYPSTLRRQLYQNRPKV